MNHHYFFSKLYQCHIYLIIYLGTMQTNSKNTCKPDKKKDYSVKSSSYKFS